MITIAPEQFERAFDAIGGVGMEVAYQKEYAEAISRCAQEIADEVDREVMDLFLAKQISGFVKAPE